MGAIFISYTGRDPEGDAWADRLVGWFQEWNYGYFRDKDHSHGIKAGEDWRASLYQELGLAQALISLCTRQYESSPWCVGEVAIAVEKGKTVIPIHLANTAWELQQQPLPLFLQDRQAIRVIPASAPTPEQLVEVKTRLRSTLEETLNWSALQPWDGSLRPYPGLPAFEAAQAPVFFGRERAVANVCEKLASLAKRAPAALLVLGASGTGKSSLVRAGVVPQLRASRNRRWLVLEPFKPGLDPFAALEHVLADHPSPHSGERDDGEAARLTHQLHSLSGAARAPVVLVIDQFEELLSDPSRPNEATGEGERFLAFLEAMLQRPATRVILLATLRTDFFDSLQTRWPNLLSRATIEPLLPIRPEDFGQLITGPANRSGMTLQPGLTERLVAESGGHNSLPLLAFTLEKLWQRREKRGAPLHGPRGERWDLSMADYEALGGFSGAVSFLANDAFNAASPGEKQRSGLRESFLLMCRIDSAGNATKRLARWEDTPMSSRGIIQRLINARILCCNADGIEIAHDSLFRCWPVLLHWIEESKDFLVWKRRVELDAEQWYHCVDDEKSDLLLSGLKLMIARKWLDQSQAMIQDEIKVFIKASIMHAESVGTSLVELAKSFGLASVAEQYHKQESEYQDLQLRFDKLSKALDRVSKKRDEAQRSLLAEIPKVFICYASEDDKEAIKVYKLLSDTGFQCWRDKEAIVPGDEWDQEIRRAIRESDFIIVLISKRSATKRGYIQREIKLALEVNEEMPENQAFIIPARIEECEVPHRISRYHYCDLFGEGGETRLAEAILVHWNSRSHSHRAKQSLPQQSEPHDLD